MTIEIIGKAARAACLYSNLERTCKRVGRVQHEFSTRSHG